MNLTDFGFGALDSRGIQFIQPLLHGLWALFVGLLDRFLRGEAPARQVVNRSSTSNLNRWAAAHPETYFGDMLEQ
jgi:hypothetical protein